MTRSAVGSRPSLKVEKSLHSEGFNLIAAIDEVGRGALCGPVTAGVVLLAPGSRRIPSGLRDSKLLSPGARQALVPKIETWVTGFAVAHASVSEIDGAGIISALRLAARRALATLAVTPDCILLDGNHDYISPSQNSLFEPDSDFGSDAHADAFVCPPVRTLIKADLRCASVAAASVLAKTTRDALMEKLAVDYPQYGWTTNRGYATRAHVKALRSHGVTEHHRQSWNLPL